MAASRALEFKVGYRVGGWTLVNGGRFKREVWRVKHDDGRHGVIKTLRPQRSGHERFEHEVATLERLRDSGGVLQVLDREDASPPTWMVTELAEPLSKRLGPKPSIGTLVSLFADIADTLLDAAEFDVVHRDIKPDNLFFVRGRAVVGDFGLATGHGYSDQTQVGGLVGAANFCAPEARASRPDIDWAAADVYAFAKTFQALLAGDRYPPPGTIDVRRQEHDLSKLGGRSADDLAHLLELATDHAPSKRPSLAQFRDELRIWLQLHPAASTPQPSGDYANLTDEMTSAAAISQGGQARIVDAAVEMLLDLCRGFGPDHGHVKDILAADASTRHEADETDDREWEFGATKQLTWDGAGGVRMVAAGLFDGVHDLRYELTWQSRTADGSSWRRTWHGSGQVQARLPSDAAERARLADAARRQLPPTLSAPSIDAELDLALRQVVTGIQRRKNLHEMHEEATELRAAQVKQAIDDLTVVWSRFGRLVTRGAGEVEVRTTHDDEDWFLTLEDRRVALWASERVATTGSALLLGTITVEERGEGDGEDRHKCQIANVYAAPDPAGDPVWHLVRFRRNDWASPPVPVAETCADGNGAIPHAVLDELVYRKFAGDFHPPASVDSSELVTAEALLRVVLAELLAMDQPAGG
ncbi:protein kinase domain-containing protein [Nocardioides stalactiti]|uniref:protein kinase domain-containing protein n=1 Tax=Nocardioides stalactiti TaxID=2755356 RepID=UPI00160173C0|nr:protein kinase [Nocardioides stalactiti]